MRTALLALAALVSASCYSPTTLSSRPPSVVRATPPVEPGGAVSEDALVQRALAASDELWLLESRADEAALGADGAGSLPNPELRAGRLSSRFRDQRRTEVEVGVRWRPPAPGELAAEGDLAQADALRARGSVKARRVEIAASVRRTAARIRAATAEIELRARQLALEERATRTMETLLGLGEATRVQVSRSELRQSGAHAALREAKTKLASARADMTALTGAPVPKRIEASPSDPAELGDPELAELDALEGAHLEAQAQLHLEELQPWPKLSFVEVSYHREEMANDSFYELKFGLEVPLFDYNGPEKRAARHRLQRTRTRFERARARQAAEIADAEVQLRSAREALDEHRREAVEKSAKPVLDAAKKRGTQGVDTLGLERAILRRQEREIQLRERVELALARQRQARGLE